MESFSGRRFVSLLVILSIGVAIGAGLERWLGPRAPAPPEPQAPAVVAAPTQTPVAPALLGVDARLSFNNNLYPSLMLSLGASFPDYLRCLTIGISRAIPGKPIEIRVDSSLFQRPLVYDTVASSASFELNPELPWDDDALRSRSQLLPETFVVSATMAGGETEQTTVTCTVHPVNEVVSRVLNPETNEWQDTSVCFAAFVNEDHPWIGKLLEEAIAHGDVDKFAGYEFGAASVTAQLQAIWNALAARGLSYVDLATTSGGSPSVATQYVRFLDQSISEKGANCVDASALFASIFRRIGLRPVLVFKPGHCFVAVYDAAQDGQLIAIETTLLGSQPFAAAVAAGAEEFSATAPDLGAPGYSLVDIAVARQAGVKPIAYVGPAEGQGNNAP